MKEPVGDICVLRDEELKSWVVFRCRGNGTRDQVRPFCSREEAASFAMSERDRYMKEEGLALDIHFPDDCPCLGSDRGLRPAASKPHDLSCKPGKSC